MKTVSEVACDRSQTVDETVLSSTEPLVLRSLVGEWSIVRAGKQSPQAAADYILQFYSGEPVTASFGPSSIKGRVAYNDEITGLNFERATVNVDEFLVRLLQHVDDPEPPAYYIGSSVADRWFPGFSDANRLVLKDIVPLTSLWIGNQINVSAHFDVTDNIACSVVGRRKFTLFPPDQLENLYIGPWDMTPAGPAISLVDFQAPDFEKYPKFRDALESAYVVTLEPGDALFLPSMWWHHVEGLEGLNVLVNYWWRTTPKFMGAPDSVLRHALLGLRELPPEQRRAWQHIFEHYVFDPQETATAHIPEQSRGILGPMNDVTARKLRADLLNRLNR